MDLNLRIEDSILSSRPLPSRGRSWITQKKGGVHQWEIPNRLVDCMIPRKWRITRGTSIYGSHHEPPGNIYIYIVLPTSDYYNLYAIDMFHVNAKVIQRMEISWIFQQPAPRHLMTPGELDRGRPACISIAEVPESRTRAWFHMAFCWERLPDTVFANVCSGSFFVIHGAGMSPTFTAIYHDPS